MASHDPSSVGMGQDVFFFFFTLYFIKTQVSAEQGDALQSCCTVGWPGLSQPQQQDKVVL